MKIIRLFTVLGILSLTVAIATFIVRQSFASHAQLVQRVEVDKVGGELFGDSEPTKIGSPQELVIGESAAFLPGTTPEGARLVNEAYLREHKIYPLQLKTVDFLASMVRLGSVAGAGMCFFVAFLLNRRRISVNHSRGQSD